MSEFSIFGKLVNMLSKYVVYAFCFLLRLQLLQEVLNKHLKWKVQEEKLYTLSDDTSPITRPILETLSSINSSIVNPSGKSPTFRHIVWTSAFRRSAVLAFLAFKFNEPLLLVGETGYEKCQEKRFLLPQFNYSLHRFLRISICNF